MRLKAAIADWEGMAYVAVYGDESELRRTGFGRGLPDFRDTYVVFENHSNGKTCGGILRAIRSSEDCFVETEACLLTDLSASVGDEIEVSPLAPVAAKEISVAVSKKDINQQELRSLCKTYLTRHPLSAGQKKQVYLFTGEKITIEILKVIPSNLAVYTNSTEIMVDTGKITSSVSGLDEIGGLDSEKKLIRDRVLLPVLQPDFFAAHGIRPPRGILLSGPPGCGKTMIARALSQEIKANFVELNCSKVFQSLYGESEKTIRECFEKARAHTPAIVLIDEIDAIGSSRMSTRGDVERRVVTALLTEMDGLGSDGDVIVVATTNMLNVLDPALRRPGRFDYEIHIGVPDKKGRLDILKKMTKHMCLDSAIRLEEIAARTYGFVGADLMMLCREAAFEALTDPLTTKEAGRNLSKVNEEARRITMRDFDNALTKVKPSAMREFTVEVPTNLSWKDIGGLDTIKETVIQEIVQILKNPEAFEKVGVTPVKGILFYGPPGTGKTLLARVIANEAEANFISIRGPEMLSKWFGESEERIRTLFTKARESSPCIIFLDEIDAIAGTRGMSWNETSDRIVNQILTEMDGFEASKHVCVIAATNRKELIDPALLRPGRFDYHILVPLPDDAGIREIYSVHLQSKPLASDISLDRLVALSRGFSGAHIAEVCRRAALQAFRENKFIADGTKVGMKHLEKALGQVKEAIENLEKPRIGFSLDKR